MRKKLLATLLSVFMIMTSFTTNVFALGESGEDTKVAKINGEEYSSLKEAIESITDSIATTITLLADQTSEGISIPEGRNITIDFAGKKVTFSKPGAGSTYTKTQALQLLKNSTIKLMNGTIECDTNNSAHTWSSSESVKGIAMIIQNYADLTLDNMTIDGTNIAHNGENVRYVVSNNSGTVNINNSTITAPTGDFAFDSCLYTGYTQPTVNLTNTKVNGRVEITGGIVNLEDKTEVTGEIRVGENEDGTSVKNGILNINKGATVNTGDKWIAVFGENTLNINGTVNGYVCTNGNEYNAGSVINVNNGAVIKNDSDVAIYMPNGELNISGGTITGTTAVYFKSTKLKISGGTLTGTGTKTDYNYNGNGGNSTGDALVIDSCNYPSGLEANNVSISGGTFVSTNASAVGSYTSQGATLVTGFISGGNFTGADLKPIDYLRDDATVTLTLTKESTTDKQIEIKEGQDVNINFNAGLTYSGTTPLNSGVLLVHNGGSLTLNSISSYGVDSTNNAYAAIALTKSGDDAEKTAKLVINDGTYSGYYYGITGNGSRKNTDITINGGTIKGTNKNDSTGIYHPQEGTLTINDGTIEGATGIYVKAGTVKTSINGGNINGTGSKGTYTTTGDGFVSTGDGLVLDNCGYPGGAPNADIKGGKFKSTSGSAVASYAKDGNTPIKNFISGGVYSTKPGDDLLVSGYMTVNNSDNTYKYLVCKPEIETVDEKTTLTSAVNSNVELKNVEGLSNAVSSQEIKNLKNKYPSANIDVTLELNANERIFKNKLDIEYLDITGKIYQAFSSKSITIDNESTRKIIDITISKTVVVDGENKESSNISTTAAYQYIPVVFDLTNNPERIVVGRIHNNVAQVLTKAASRNDADRYNGDCYYLDKENGAVVIKSKNFSTYEIISATSDVEAYTYVPPTPNHGYKVPNTGVEGYTNNHSLLKLSYLSLLAIGSYIVIKKKKDNE